MRVMVIPEGFRLDQYVFDPIVQAMLRHLGKPRATVRICRDPLLGGVDEALKWENVAKILVKYQNHIDLFLLCVDRDGRTERRARLDSLERLAVDLLRRDQSFLAENAWQEIEVWVLAGHDLPREWSWNDVRQELNPKEVYFADLARRRDLATKTDGGRRVLTRQAARRYDRIPQLCPEDVLNLETRIGAWLEGKV